MALDPSIMNLLVCPLCKGALLDFRPEPDTQYLACVHDALAYPIQQGIPMMMPDHAKTLSEAEVLQLKSVQAKK